MRILLIDNHSYHTQELAKLLEDHEIIFSDCLTADHLEERYDLVILSGSHEFPFYSENFAKELAFIQHTDIPIIGICLGCQLIAHAYGSSFHREENKIAWLYNIKYIPNQSHYIVYEGHSFCINEISDELLPIAVSEFGYEIIKHTTKQQRWVQFHPEVEQPHNHGAMLFTTLLSKILL